MKDMKDLKDALCTFLKLLYPGIQLEDDKAALHSRSSQETEARTSHLEKALTTHKEVAAKTQTEVDRLLDILKQMEGEKNEKDRQIKELQE